MAKIRKTANSTSGGDRQFAVTRWSLVLAAGRRSSPDSRQALEVLCGTYWYPLYAYGRRRVADRHEAQDLTQAFFASLLERGALAAANRERGRFRSFLLTSFQHFLADEWDKAKAQKRGGGRRPLQLDFASGESRYSREPVDEVTPERLYEKQWALTFLDHVLRRLGDEYAAKGKSAQFEAIKPLLAGRGEKPGYEAAASRLGIGEPAVKVAVHRARRRYREILRAEIVQIVSGPEEVDDEIRHLRAALG
jgi:DNA-directed RNA polymerase specialized sigma24 family protein